VSGMWTTIVSPSADTVARVKPLPVAATSRILARLAATILCRAAAPA
jgi:hypothetical protein